MDDLAILERCVKDVTSHETGDVQPDEAAQALEHLRERVKLADEIYDLSRRPMFLWPVRGQLFRFRLGDILRQYGRLAGRE